MLSKTASILWLSGLFFVAGCGGGGGGGSGAFYVETCSLGCSNGVEGGQVTCGVVNMAENQDVALLFSAPVDLSSVSKQSFQIFDIHTAAVPPGSFLIDPLNDRRLIFRPKLSFDSAGNPVFGFKEGSSYRIFLAGTNQGDPGPFVMSTQGRANQARVLCTITTNGIVDPIPGKPSVQIFVDQKDPGTGQLTTVELFKGVVPGAVNVAETSKITFLFDELMNVGTLLVPTTGQAPFIRVDMDTDGNLNTIVDRIPIEGLYSFSVDVNAQTTTLLFTPDGRYPGAGADPQKPRLVVIDVPAAVTDIASNPLANAGVYNFAPVANIFPQRTLPDGGEDFGTTVHRDPRRSGADWGTASANLLTPGEGGGSGRMGDLVVRSGETRVLNTSPSRASGTIRFLATPEEDNKVQVAGIVFTFKAAPALETDVPIRPSLAFTLSSLADTVNAYGDANPTSGPAKCRVTQLSIDTVGVEAKDAGSDGNALTMAAIPSGNVELSGATLSGGKLGEAFANPSTITNFDFEANPGVKPPQELVDDGVFEFTRVALEPDSTLIVAGDMPARLLVRGDFTLPDGSTIDAAGEAKGLHGSITPYGQPAGRAGPGGGRGGRGGDRVSVTDASLQLIGAVALAVSELDGSYAEGVGGSDPATPFGQGRGGQHWPLVFPTSAADFGDLAVITDGFTCYSHQVGGAGSGGAYATDGSRGVAITDAASGTTFSGATYCSLPRTIAPPCTAIHRTPEGLSLDVGLEPPAPDPILERLLTPALDFLRGGAGGGGGAAHLKEMSTFGIFGCFDLGYVAFTDNSAAAGGGGGGALQVQVGDDALLAGVIDAGGGSGGSAETEFAYGTRSSPGGGGAGGAVLVEAKNLDLDPSSGRIIVSGGAGGSGVVGSLGGQGGNGLARIEQAGGGLTATVVAQSVEPTDPGDPTSVKWLSVGEWTYVPGETTDQEAISGSQSCWMVTPDDAFSLTFLDDPAAPAAPADMGWNMDVILDLGNPGDPQAYPFRGSDGLGPYGGLYPEERWGQLLNYELLPGEDPAPVVVRFQGARRDGPILDLCNVDLSNPQSGVLAGSVTPWMPQPKDANFFYPPSDMIRWVILFDRKAPLAGDVLGVTNLRIEAQPE